MAPYSRNGLQTAHSKTGPGGRKLKLAETCAILSLVQLVMPGLAFAAELNLGSSDPHFTVDQNHQGSVNLTVNGESKTVGAGSALTAAEYATFLNISHGLEQTLTIGAGGVATGGTLTLTPQLAGNITGLTVPTNVSVVHDFATGVPFNLAGNFNNSGEFYAVSTSQAVTNAVIGAANFTNNTGALLTSVLPHTGLAGITGAISNLSLTLNVLNNLTNMGAITSAGNLNINAGAIYNQLPVGVAGVSPIMQAVNNLNLNATLGSITNSGILAATTGNINLASLNNLVVNNVNGSIQALAGTINIRNTNFDVLRDLNINLTGGNWLSQQLNIDAGCGTLEAEVREITGQVNVNAAAANLGAATQNLNLGTINITGDPTWFNTAGNVLISGPITATGVSPNIAILASGHIVAVTGATVIDSSTAQTGGNGGTLTLVAGANFFFGTGSGTNDTGTNLVIDSPSGAASGGGIYLDGTAPVGFVGTPAAITGMTSAGTGGNNSGGDIALVAYAGTSAGSGVVRLPSAVTVTSGGAGLGTNGSITMLAGATSGTAISAGGLQTSGSQLTAGSITLAAATPTINGSGTVSIIGGAIQAGSGTFVAGTLQNAAVSVGNLVAAGAGGSGSTVVSPVVSGGAGGNISIASKSNITTGALRVFGGGAGGGTISPGAGGSGGSIMLSTLQDITISGDVNASGGGGGAGLSGNFGSGGKGGSINITSIGALSISGPILAAGGGAGGTNTSAAGAGGGGGSFGGGGGAGISQGGGGGGGGGYYGGGGAGGELNGAPSGGGGYSGGGGGGGGGGGLAPGMFGGGGGGGGGLGIGGGGGGGQGVSSTAGGAGGAGGTAGTAGTKAGGTPGIGGAGFGGGGAGAASSSTTPGGSGGKGGTGGTAGPGVGTGGAPTGGSGGMFGMGGTAGGAIGAPTNGGDAGTSGAGGNIVLSGQRVTLTGTIGTASANWAGFATSVYAGDTVNALGAGGSITITSRGGTISPTYFADGNYASGATAVPITITSSNSLTSTGGMQAPSITFSGAAQTSPVAGGSFAGLAEIGIIEGDFVVNVTNFLAVTPAELIALIQAGSSNLRHLSFRGSVSLQAATLRLRRLIFPARLRV